jgi:hypothetical protein
VRSYELHRVWVAAFERHIRSTIVPSNTPLPV